MTNVETNKQVNKLFKAAGLVFAVFVPVSLIYSVFFFLNQGNTSNSKIVSGFTAFSKQLVAFFAKLPKEITFAKSDSKTTQVGELQAEDENLFSPFADKLGDLYGSAVRFTADSVGIDISLTPVGVNIEDKSLEAPVNSREGGWYKRGSKPGESGNMVINAHYDDSTGRAAAFWPLKNIKVGDTVVVEDSLGKGYEYKVTKYYYVGIDDPNRADVYKDPADGKSIVTLITCSGIWIPGEGTYNKRLVVVGELVEKTADSTESGTDSLNKSDNSDDIAFSI